MAFSYRTKSVFISTVSGASGTVAPKEPGELKCVLVNRPNRLTQCCTQFKSPGTKILCVLHLHDNVAFIFK